MYGKVVDVFIPNRKSKAGKRFAFVRFIKVENVERLVGNLCTLWIGRYHLQANVARFERRTVSSSFVKRKSDEIPRKTFGAQSNANSYGAAVKSSTTTKPDTLLPAIVLDDECLIDRDLCNAVMGENASNNNVEDGPGVHIEEESDCYAVSDTFFWDSDEANENAINQSVNDKESSKDPFVQKARSQTLRSELESLKMKESETISVFARKLSSIRAKFRNLGTTLESKIIVRKLLNSVPKKFLPIVATIEQYQDLDEMSFEEVTGRLTAFEKRIKSQDTLEANNQDKLLTEMVFGFLALVFDQKTKKFLLVTSQLANQGQIIMVYDDLVNNQALLPNVGPNQKDL
nr:zinc finger, CCHC-type [Tanacetum cinerariifolium]